MSELCSFTVRVYEDVGKTKQALETIEKLDKKILDNIDKQETIARLNLKLGNNEKAVEAYEAMLRYNSANRQTYMKIIQASGINLPTNIAEKLSSADQAKVKELMDKYAQVLPRVNTHTRISLRYLQGDDFESRLRQYIKPQIIKGVPSIMHELRELYVCSDKSATI